jgi:hypothetical protein
MIKTCKVHGSTDFSGASRPRCRKCLVAAVIKRRRKLKILAVAYKGGKCEKCGYSKCIDALEFHHMDPSKKEFGLSARGITRAWSIVKLELDKCKLLCANCHREVHAVLV